MNKAEHFLRTGQGLCDECSRPVEPERVLRAKGLGPFLCGQCAERVMSYAVGDLWTTEHNGRLV